MLEGMYTAAAGMAAQQSRLDAVANDLANASTTGYKSVRMAYRDLAYTAGAPGATTALRVGSGAAAAMIGRNDAQGASQETGRSLDVAIQGPGFIQVKDGTKRSLTRDGNLQVDAQGRLAMQDGALLEPPVTVPKGTTEDQIAIGRRRHRHGERQGRRQDHPRHRRQHGRPRRRRRQPLPGHRHERRREPRSAHDAPRVGRARDLQRRHGRRR